MFYFHDYRDGVNNFTSSRPSRLLPPRFHGCAERTFHTSSVQILRECIEAADASGAVKRQAQWLPKQKVMCSVMPISCNLYRAFVHLRLPSVHSLTAYPALFCSSITRRVSQDVHSKMDNARLQEDIAPAILAGQTAPLNLMIPSFQMALMMTIILFLLLLRVPNRLVAGTLVNMNDKTLI